jgi:uroporphyrinogen-III decarboxylase
MVAQSLSPPLTGVVVSPLTVASLLASGTFTRSWKSLSDELSDKLSR